MIKTPMVSVLMIIYNHEKFIEQAIGSVLLQNCNFNVEFIIANDKSTDLTDQVINKYLSEADVPENIKIEYVNHNENKGMMSNFIWTLNQAKGKYIAICEGDDYWTDPLKLQKQVDFLESNEDYALHCTNAFLSQKGNLKRNAQISKTFTEVDILKMNFTYTASLCLRRKNIKVPNFIYKSPAADWLLILYSLQGQKAYFSSDVTCAYRIHEGGIWSQLEQENPTAIKKRFENLKKNALIYKCISKDNTFNNQVKKLAKYKQESYAYQAKRMTIIYPYLTLSSDDLMPKSLSSFVKLNLTKLKKAF